MIEGLLIRLAVGIPLVALCYFYETNPRFKCATRRCIKIVLITLLEALVSMIACAIFVNTLENLRDRDGDD